MILSAAVLAGGLAGCTTKEQVTQKAPDLRFRAESSYALEAVSAQAFTIYVTSSEPWTIRNEHPTWCYITVEDGEASDAALVFLGKSEPTAVTIQYYDNTGLDDREDVIEIKSDYWVGKRINVYQKGIAYLTVPEEDLAIDVVKTGGACSFQVNSNQDWTAVVTDGADWLTITDGAEGSLDGTVALSADSNAGEQRYASVTVYDRNGVEMYVVRFTQDGVQLEPATLEVRAEWDQAFYELEVGANVDWTVAKKEGCEDDNWYTLVNPDNSGSGTLRITFQNNNDGYIRDSRIVLKNVVASEDDFVTTKEIWIRQAYKVVPIRHAFDEDEIATWGVTKREGTWLYDPSFNGTGMLLPSPTQIKKTPDAPGTYIFHWRDMGAASRCRLWYVVSQQEIIYNLEGGSTDIRGNDSFGSLPGAQNVSYDTTAASHDMGIGFTPASGGYCHVSFYLDGTEFYSCDTGKSLGSNYTWGTKVDVYLGVDHGDSAVIEWYEYTPPFSWGDDE